MAEIIPIERALEQRNKKIEKKNKSLLDLIEDIKVAKSRIELVRDHPHVANEEFINELNRYIAEMNQLLEVGTILQKRNEARTIENYRKRANFIFRRLNLEELR